MKQTLTLFAFLACCVFGASDQIIAYVAAPRQLLVMALVFWLRYEWHIRLGDRKEEAEEIKLVKDNYELSQTVLNLSQQHTLLCEIRNSTLRTLKCTRHVSAELKVPSFKTPPDTLSHTGNSTTPSPDVKSASTPEKSPPPLRDST